MVNYLEIISSMMDNPNYLLAVLITMYAIIGTLDFIVGSVTVEKGAFSSRISQLGIIRKIVTLAIMILVIPLALMLPMEVGIYSLTILYVGVVGSEIYSILGNVGLVEDGKKYDGLTGSMFTDLISKVFKHNKIDK